MDTSAMQAIPHPDYWAVEGGACHPGCLLSTGELRLRKRAWKRKVRPVDLALLVEITAGLCMVCRRCHASIVEHCHFTGRVRGLVCRDCNARIAFIEGGIGGRRVLRQGRCPCTDWASGYRRAARAGLVPPFGTADGAVMTRFLDDWLSGDGQRLRALEQATYDFLDHAQEPLGHDLKQAFTWLVDHPYPDHHGPVGAALVAAITW